MKERRLLYALSRVDERYVEEASFKQTVKKGGWMKWGVAVCLCVAVGLAVSVFSEIGSGEMGSDNMGNDTDGAASMTPGSQTASAITLFADQNIVDEMRRDISEEDLRGWMGDLDGSMEIDFGAVLPVYEPVDVTDTSNSLLETLALTDEYVAPAVCGGVCVGTFTLVRCDGKWAILMFTDGFDLESALVKYEDQATCFLSIPQLGHLYGFLTSSEGREGYVSLSSIIEETRDGAELLEQLKALPDNDDPDSDG